MSMNVTAFPEVCDDCEGILITICHAQDRLAAADKGNRLVAHLQIQDDEERRLAQSALLQSFSSSAEVAMGPEEQAHTLRAYLSALLAAYSTPNPLEDIKEEDVPY